MEDIIYLRTGRDRATLHGGQHLGHYHERLSRRPALLGDLALDTRKVPEMNGISKVMSLEDVMSHAEENLLNTAENVLRLFQIGNIFTF